MAKIIGKKKSDLGEITLYMFESNDFAERAAMFPNSLYEKVTDVVGKLSEPVAIEGNLHKGRIALGQDNKRYAVFSDWSAKLLSV